MRVIEGEDVNELYWRGMTILRAEGRLENSRNGPVRVLPEPVTSVYREPRQRVLFDRNRKANPFFHLYESLWMLAGRNDVAALNRYITDFGTRFAEPNGEVHGAYGHRWRRALGFDQLESIVQKLKKDPTSRHGVLQMWDARATMVKCRSGECDPQPSTVGWNDLDGEWKDRPCNTQVYFRVREIGRRPQAVLLDQADMSDIVDRELDMMITCRSNDIVFGAYGANAVHFSILQEYVAGRIGVPVGKMYQVSWNWHGYVNTMEKMGEVELNTYKGLRLRPQPMVTSPDEWDEDLGTFMRWHDNMLKTGETHTANYSNDWFKHTAEPMFLAHYRWKSALKQEARSMAKLIEAEDWRAAVAYWFDTRTEARSR